MRSHEKYRNNLWAQVVQQSESGFTLVEIMVAIVVLSIGLLAGASMQLSAVHVNSSANGMTAATNLAQSRLEELMALEYTKAFTNLDLMGDDSVGGSLEPFTDSNSNGLWDFGESYVDSNGNSIWDAAHVDPNPSPDIPLPGV